MTLQEFINKYNATKFLFQFSWMKSPCTTIVLASTKYGVSIKPCPANEQERKNLIQAKADYEECSYEKAREQIEAADYCFIQGHPNIEENDLKFLEYVLATGESIPHRCLPGKPICQFA